MNQPKILETLQKETRNTQVLIFAGGKAKRMGFIDMPKPLLKVAGKPLIDRCIEYLRDNGFTDFIILVGYKGEEIIRHVGFGEKYGIKIKYSKDPPLPAVGKAKALKHAIETGVVDASRRAFIAFPDDIFLDQTLPARFLLSHVEAARTKNTIASALLASALDLPYGVAKVDPNGYITEFREKPTINILISTGLYIFEPEVLQIILDKISMEDPHPIEFEQTILPLLANQRKMYAHIIPKNTWLPVNTIKQLEHAEYILEKQH